jgi:hypothetical protein
MKRIVVILRREPETLKGRLCSLTEGERLLGRSRVPDEGIVIDRP